MEFSCEDNFYRISIKDFKSRIEKVIEKYEEDNYKWSEEYSHLDPDNVVHGDCINIQEEVKNYICHICHMIVRDPEECADCNNFFCSKCLDKWLVNKNYCPLKCKESGFHSVKLNRFVKERLQKLVFRCRHDPCIFEETYD